MDVGASVAGEAMATLPLLHNESVCLLELERCCLCAPRKRILEVICTVCLGKDGQRAERGAYRM